jgi:L-fuculose-phosphate aldolase
MPVMPRDNQALRQEIIDACLKMNALGINQGSAGNISVRVDGGLLITPSGMPYDSLVPDDIVFMATDGSVPSGQKNPSSEWPFHLDILDARSDAGAVVHTHAMFSTTLACLHRDIPAFHYMVAVAGGDSIRCAPYATFGTQALSDHALKALEDRRACLLANHGMIALGDTLPKALAMAVEVETLATQFWRALQAGEPVLLPADEMQRVLKKFQSYGAQPDDGS